MTTILGIPTAALFGQLLLGLINGSFYAILSLGLAVIFGLLNIINFTHGAQYMMGAFVAYFPALALTGRPDPLGFPDFVRYCSPLVAAAMVGVAALVWRTGVRRYQGTGS